MSTVLVDTSVWSRFYRSDFPDSDPVVSALSGELAERGVVTTGVVYLELLRGFTRPASRSEITSQFGEVPFIEPEREDYAAAADLSVTCRRAGLQLATVDALIAQVCITHDLTLLTADTDFTKAASHIPLHVWSPA